MDQFKANAGKTVKDQKGGVRVEIGIKQHGRASLDFAAAIAGQIFTLARPVAEAVVKDGFTEDTLAENLDERDQQITFVADQLPCFRVSNLCREWYCDHHGQIAMGAFEEMGDAFESRLELGAVGPTTLDKNPSYQPPPWWTNHWIHRTHGGWDGHPHMGFIYGELVHGYLVSKISSGDIDAQRQALADSLPDVGKGCILEIGCSSGQFTRVLARHFPDADITSCDISIRQLEQAQRTLNEMDARVRLIKCSGEDTGLEASSCDVVVSYAILHEIPVDVTERIFRETYRVLKPGGLAVFGDVPPYEELGKFMQWKVDFGARNEGEPFWRESATLDVRALLMDIGFEKVERFGMTDGPYPFPYVTRARKPV